MKTSFLLNALLGFCASVSSTTLAGTGIIASPPGEIIEVWNFQDSDATIPKKKPDADFRTRFLVAELKKGDTVNVLDVYYAGYSSDEKRYIVELPNGSAGYVLAKYIKPTGGEIARVTPLLESDLIGTWIEIGEKRRREKRLSDPNKQDTIIFKPDQTMSDGTKKGKWSIDEASYISGCDRRFHLATKTILIDDQNTVYERE